MTAQTTRKRLKIVAHPLVGGGFIVRGTLDPMEALKIAAVHGDDGHFGPGWQAVRVFPGESARSEAPLHVQALADYCHTLLGNARSGLWRIVPSNDEDEDYSWSFREASQRARGVFEGVVLW